MLYAGRRWKNRKYGTLISGRVGKIINGDLANENVMVPIIQNLLASNEVPIP